MARLAYHRLDIWVRNGLELREPQLVVRTDVDVRTLVLRHVAILGSREDYTTQSV